MGNFRLVKSICLIVGLVLVSISFSEGGRTPLRVKNGIVTSASRLASDAGVSALKQGGNAVDAAITTAYVSGAGWQRN
jgi:gamma-glutamyltranspeptidase/glutathione hydrolase